MTVTSPQASRAMSVAGGERKNRPDRGSNFADGAVGLTVGVLGLALACATSAGAQTPPATDAANTDDSRTESTDGADSTDNTDTSASGGRTCWKSLGKLHGSPIS